MPQSNSPPLSEGKIILPCYDNDHKPVRDAHEWLAARLTARFGGCTTSPGIGYWDDGTKAQREMVTVYYVALSRELSAARLLLYQAAIDAARMARQKAVYIQYPNGVVEIATVEGAKV